MTTNPGSTSKAWQMIENEKKRDQLVKKVSLVAWVITFMIASVFAAMIIAQVFTISQSLLGRGVPFAFVIEAVTPLVRSLGILAFLVATLATVGMFFRLRTASFNEIQLRLAALEDMLADRSNSIK